MIVVVMGVAGCGKSTVGRLLAERRGWSFRDADDLHPPENIAKMTRGEPLDDADRAPWLARVRAEIDARAAAGDGAVFACSALRERYRRALGDGPGEVRFVWLHGDFETIRERLRRRTGHYMGEAMLASQFAALEAPADALALDAGEPPQKLVERIEAALPDLHPGAAPRSEPR